MSSTGIPSSPSSKPTKMRAVDLRLQHAVLNTNLCEEIRMIKYLRKAYIKEIAAHCGALLLEEHLACCSRSPKLGWV